MPKYLYKAKNNRGDAVTGTVLAPNEYEAEKVLIKNGLVLSELIAEKQESILRIFTKKVSVRDRAIISRQLATMLSAGLPLSKAVTIIAKQAKNEQQRQIFLEIYKDIEQGYSFSVALSKHPEAFDRVFVSVVGSGETTGKLDVVLAELANQLERDSTFVSKVKTSLFYPGFIFGVVIIAGVVMLVVVVPKLKTMFDSAKRELPLITNMLLALSSFFQAWWWAVLILAIVVFVLMRFWQATPAGARIVHRYQMKIPGLNVIMEGLYMYRFTRIMAMLIGAGVPLLDAIKIGSSVIDNPIYEDSLSNIANQVEKGVPLSTQLLRENAFPQLVGNMVAVGEETGALDQVLNKVADYYEETTNESIKSISALVEPVILVIVGLAVAFIVFAIYIPIYQINSTG